MPDVRVGIGYDVHRLVPGRRLVLGGVEIEHELGLDGHSDADVALHALCDALLGAAALGDIGQHFPPTDPAYKDISSLELLRHVQNLLGEVGFRTNNVDLTIVAERPRISPHAFTIRSNLSSVLDLDLTCISIKATTNERLGFIGQELGIAAWAVVTIVAAP